MPLGYLGLIIDVEFSIFDLHDVFKGLVIFNYGSVHFLECLEAILHHSLLVLLVEQIGDSLLLIVRNLDYRLVQIALWRLVRCRHSSVGEGAGQVVDLSLLDFIAAADQHFVRSLHERTREKGLPMLQISQHIIELYDAISDFESCGHRLIATKLLQLLITLNLKLVKVDPGTILLDFVDGSSSCRPRKVSVMRFVLRHVGIVEVSRVFNRQYQINGWQFLKEIIKIRLERSYWRMLTF